MDPNPAPYGAPPPDQPGMPPPMPGLPPTPYGAPGGAYGAPAGTYPGVQQPAVQASVTDLAMGTLAGAAVAAIGALLWGVAMSATGFSSGLYALALGVGVGYAVHFAAGRPQADIRAGVIGAVLGLLGSVGGYLAGITMVASGHGLTLTLSEAWDTFTRVVSPISFLLIGIGSYEGFKLAMGGVLGTMRKR